MRVVLSDEEYQALLGVSRQVDWRFHVALVLAHETGHRIGAIRQLRWSDIILDGGVVRWRVEHEKTGYEHRTPVKVEALAVLEEARKRSSGHEDSPVLPAPRDASRCAGRTLVRFWWNRAQKLAGLEPKRGRGWDIAMPPGGGVHSIAQGALRAGRLEDGPDQCSSATSGPTRTGSERPSRTAEGPVRDPFSEHK